MLDAGARGLVNGVVFGLICWAVMVGLVVWWL